MQKRQLGPCVTFFPQPLTLIASRDTSGLVNLMAASWVGIVSKTPPTIAVALNDGRKTYENIKANGVFSVNLVPSKYAAEADFCGLAPGNKVDKLPIAGFDIAPGTVTGSPLVVQSPLNVECRFTEEVVLGDYRVVLGEIVEIHAAEEAFDENGKADVRTFDPLVYLGGIREYWSLGEKVADAYRAGLDLMPKASDKK